MSVEKKPPTWATVVGILGVTFGAFGLMGGGYELMMPMMMSLQKRMMQGMKETIKEQPQAQDSREGKTAAPQVNPDALFKVMEDFMSGPPWYERFSYINGALQLVLSALYILASVFLLLLRRGAATFFVSVAAISALRNLVAIGAGISAGSFFAFWTVTSGSAGFLIDLVLIIVVAVSDRSMYR
jgi:hypothetical protein